MATDASLTKAEFRRLVEISGEAWEAELGMHLDLLLEQFNAWKAKSIGALELSDKIHEFHDGINRELHNFYTGRRDDAHLRVASAVARGILAPDRLEEGLAAKLAPLVNRIKKNLEEDAHDSVDEMPLAGDDDSDADK